MADVTVGRIDRAAFALASCTTFFRHAERYAGGAIDLALRWWVAQMFLVSAILKLADWDKALYLAAHEYPVAWLDPVTAAYVGVTIELAGALLLLTGLATRVAAAMLLALLIVVQLDYLALDLNLLEIALLSAWLVHGAGALSLDRMLARGLVDSAVPLAGPAVRALAAFSRAAAPLHALARRAWLAGALLAAFVSLPGAVAKWLPVTTAGAVGAWCVVPAVLLALGCGTRVAALALAAAFLAQRIMSGGDAHFTAWTFLLVLVALRGAGALSLDALLLRLARSRVPGLDGRPAFALDGVPRVVIVGAGFGGIACAAKLARARVAITLIDRHNYHLFQPLLYQVATAGLSPGDIAAPVRGMFRDVFNVRVLLGEVTGVDTAARRVLVAEQTIPYDYLVLATGAAHSYFGRDDWAPFAPGLKRVEDATEVRRRLLLAFEQAEATEDAQERERLLTFLVVGGGPTGVELAGAIAELARWGMEKEFRRFDPAHARVVLVQAGPRLLPTFPEELSRAARASLERLRVEVLVDSRVEAIDDDGAIVNGRRVPSRTVLWAAGVIASPAARWLGASADSAGRVKVDAHLCVPDCANVFAVGDTAAAQAWNGNAVPGLAPAAKQAGTYVAGLIRARIEDRADPAPFAYRHLGSLATIGRKAAVVDFGFLRLSGALAWWFWGAVHVGFLVDVRSRLSVMFDWFWAYLTYRSGTRLITGTAAGAPRTSTSAPAAREGMPRERLAAHG
jgi:NADH dehydrogenase/putative oxidoreductase